MKNDRPFVSQLTVSGHTHHTNNKSRQLIFPLFPIFPRLMNDIPSLTLGSLSCRTHSWFRRVRPKKLCYFFPYFAWHVKKLARILMTVLMDKELLECVLTLDMNFRIFFRIINFANSLQMASGRKYFHNISFHNTFKIWKKVGVCYVNNELCFYLIPEKYFKNIFLIILDLHYLYSKVGYFSRMSIGTVIYVWVE